MVSDAQAACDGLTEALDFPRPGDTLVAARARGGRKRVLTDNQVAATVALMRDPKTSVAEVCKTFNISKATL